MTRKAGASNDEVPPVAARRLSPRLYVVGRGIGNGCTASTVLPGGTLPPFVSRQSWRHTETSAIRPRLSPGGFGVEFQIAWSPALAVAPLWFM